MTESLQHPPPPCIKNTRIHEFRNDQKVTTPILCLCSIGECEEVHFVHFSYPTARCRLQSHRLTQKEPPHLQHHTSVQSHSWYATANPNTQLCLFTANGPFESGQMVLRAYLARWHSVCGQEIFTVGPHRHPLLRVFPQKLLCL